MARDEPHPVAAAYRLDRFATGALLDESGGGADLVMH
jgi:sarcosine oxidase subunit beta